ncbi:MULTISPECIES: 16S rRNA (uracil(1498)-N(3))-methyltransferase [unclassified Thioalkalivibrio]|uniref:16S rRNA (uracil(1498)-N(3))-methyltransferase n=1 Tax=unclassified Thioalkalivibrio TaxID=2621013 RepID=UPI00037394F1|nr:MULTISPECIES: 16S rRNA (uracil(1498)-N(3))-methyltransferase [unclassified Thioalkalivibrio]
MRCPRLLITDTDLAAGQSISASQDRLHYATNVLRLKNGTACRVFDGQGNEFHARLEITGRRSGTLHLGDRAAAPTTPARPIELLQGIARGDHMDLAVQKAVELGVSVIRPVLCERSRSAAAHRGLEKRHAHWAGIIQAAAEQCGRNELPFLAPPAELNEALSTTSPTLDLVADEQGRPLSRILDEATPPHAVRILIGPEGGLTNDERHDTLKAGFQPVAIGPRTLRTETAAISLLTLVQWKLGDLDSGTALT